MAVSLKTITTLDTNSGRGNKVRDVHYLVVNKVNKKGAKALIGGTSLQLLPDGEFYIPLLTTVNGKAKTVDVRPNDVVFRTHTSKRWQVMSRRGFNKRFPNAKV